MTADQSSEHRSVLFLTYDGLLDQLGSSQILPYLKNIAKHSQRLHILSFEKPGLFEKAGPEMMSELSILQIGWTPLSFTTGAGKIGKLWDLSRMYLTAVRLQQRHLFSIVHCRSYQAMQVGCLLKRLYNVKTLFDMRGLWVDERIDGGIWRRDRWLDRLIFCAYKSIEKRLLVCADHVIALTNRVVPELRRLSPMMAGKVDVIPCCADFDHFALPNTEQRLAIRSSLGIANDGRVIAYLGSLGTWYMLDDMLRLFAQTHERWGNVHLLLITRDWRTEHESAVERIGLASLRDRIHVRSATRTEVPLLLGCADVMLSLIKPAYSKLASSPTKLAEAFALGVPVISNTGIGDVDDITTSLDAGALVDLEDAESISNVVEQLDAIAAKGGVALRDRARPILGLEVAQMQYRHVYDQLDQTRGPKRQAR